MICPIISEIDAIRYVHMHTARLSFSDLKIILLMDLGWICFGVTGSGNQLIRHSPI